MVVQRCSPSNLTELESICREEWEKLSKYRCSKLVASYPRRLEAVITARGAAIKYRVKVLNTYVNVIFKIFIFNTFSNISKLFLLCHYDCLEREAVFCSLSVPVLMHLY
jgi:hypothetical protein